MPAEAGRASAASWPRDPRRDAVTIVALSRLVYRKVRLAWYLLGCFDAAAGREHGLGKCMSRTYVVRRTFSQCPNAFSWSWSGRWGRDCRGTFIKGHLW